MIRAKLKERFGKTEGEQPPTAGASAGAASSPSEVDVPEETPEEVSQEDEDEGTSVSKMILYVF